MDEARHVEVFARYVHEKLEWEWPINPNLKELLDATIKDSRWDFKYLGMQIIIEGLAMAAFGNLYQLAQEPLLKDLLHYVMKDESRHVAFGVLVAARLLRGLPANELRDREDFIIYACELMREPPGRRRDRRGDGLERARRCATVVLESPIGQLFRQMLFMRIVPNLKKLGLITPRVREAFERARASSSSRTTTRKRRIDSWAFSSLVQAAQPTQSSAVGTASRRAGAIGSPQRRQVP